MNSTWKQTLLLAVRSAAAVLAALTMNAGCSQADGGRIEGSAADADNVLGDAGLNADQQGATDAEVSLSDQSDADSSAGTDATPDGDTIGAELGDTSPDASDATADIGGPSCQGQCGAALTSEGCGCDIDCAAKNNCCGDYAAQCKAEIGVCGDNKCHPKEAALGCLQDCKSKGDYSCLIEQCPAEYNALAGQAYFDYMLDCMSHCTSDLCRGECAMQVNVLPGGFQKLTALGSCAKSKCGQVIPNVGGLCGDGVCTKAEMSTCPADCAGCNPDACDTSVVPAWSTGCPSCYAVAETPAESCAAASCGASWSHTCGWLCRKEFACMEKYGSLDVCVPGPWGSAGNGLTECALAANCFQPTETWTCEGKCGQTFADEPCGCAPDCILSGDCCSDFALWCPTLAKEHCGNGACEATAGETAVSCAVDCGPKPCADTGSCATGLVCCGIGASSICALPADCTATD